MAPEPGCPMKEHRYYKTNVHRTSDEATDVTHEFNAIMGRLNLTKDVSSNNLYRYYDFVDDVSNKR